MVQYCFLNGLEVLTWQDQNGACFNNVPREYILRREYPATYPQLNLVLASRCKCSMTFAGV